jgi:glutamyl-tRNA reductase
MSGAVAAQALHERFEQVRQSEWSRLGRKVAGLDAAQRHEVEAIVAHIVRALADQPARQLRAHDEPQLTDAALRLFGVSGLNGLSFR